MDKLTRKNIIKLAKDFAINLSDDDLDYILKASTQYERHAQAIRDFKVDPKVKEMHHPYEKVVAYLRDDNKIHNLTKEEILAIAPCKNKDYVLIDRVVK